MKFHRFKIISIEHESKLNVEATFVLPCVSDSFQRIYFSKDKKFMINKFANARVFLYKQAEELKSNGEVHYEFVKKFYHFNDEIQA